MKCYKCQKELSITGKILFRATCEHCDVDLHTCKNCRHYFPGKPNDCNVPETEHVKDRERSNLCEDFSYIEKAPQKKTAKVDDISKRLFGSSSNQSINFDSIFKDF